MSERPPSVIAIDGHAAAGKSTLARQLAQQLGYRIMDTGAVYRAFTWAALQAGIAPDDTAGAEALAARISIEITGPDGADAVVDGQHLGPAELRSPAVSASVSPFSAMPGVRARLLETQRRFAASGKAIIVGRDIGTVVCPDADIKFFLTADAATRATRRGEQATQWGDSAGADAARRDIEQRDAYDSSRQTAPLRRADDAIVIDTGVLDQEAALARALEAMGVTA